MTSDIAKTAEIRRNRDKQRGVMVASSDYVRSGPRLALVCAEMVPETAQKDVRSGPRLALVCAEMVAETGRKKLFFSELLQ